MDVKNWALVVFELFVWYGFIFVLLYVFKNPVNLYFYSLVLLVLAYVGTVYCPWFRATDAFKEITKK